MPKSEEQRWNLDDIVLLDKFDSLYEEVESALFRYNKFYETMTADMSEQTFKEFVDFNEDLREKIHRLCYRADLWESTDQKSTEAKRLKSRCDDLEVKYMDSSRKIQHWMKGKETEGKAVLDNENAKRVFSCVPDLTYVLEHMREAAKHTLSEAEESIISKKDIVGVEVLEDLRTLIQTEFTYFFKPKGKKKRKNHKNTSADRSLHVF